MAYKYKGRMYDTKADMQAAKAAEANSPLAKAKKKFGFFSKEAKEERIRARNAKKPANKSIEQGKRNTAATSKMYAAESMFKSAKNRDDAKVKPGKARSFKDAFDAANKADKNKFLHKGKSYFTTKGAADNRDKMKTRTGEAGSMSSAKPTGPTKSKGKLASVFSKFKSSKTGSEFFKKLKKKK